MQGEEEIDIMGIVIAFIEQRPELFINVKKQRRKSRQKVDFADAVWGQHLASPNIRDLNSYEGTEHDKTITYDDLFRHSVMMGRLQNVSYNLYDHQYHLEERRSPKTEGAAEYTPHTFSYRLPKVHIDIHNTAS